jgi:hypothetical protein
MQYLHRMQVAVDRGAEGKSGKVFVANISEEKAMELAGRVVSEGFVWTVRQRSATDLLHAAMHVAKESVDSVSCMQVAIATLALEYERQKRKDLARAAKEKAFADKCETEHQVGHTAHLVLAVAACPDAAGPKSCS